MPADEELTNSSGSKLLIQQMSQSLGLLRVAFDSTGEAMLIVDDSNEIRWANQQSADWLGGGITLKLVGHVLSKLLHFYHLDKVLVADDDPSHPLNKAFFRDGQKSFLIHAIQLSNEVQDQSIVRLVRWRQIIQLNQRFVLLMFRDLDPIERALATQRQFINNLAHELRTPLAIVKGNLRRVKRNDCCPDTLSQPLSDALEEVVRMTNLVDNLLMLSQLDSDFRRWDFKLVDLAECVDQWINDQTPDHKNLIQFCPAESASGFQVWIDQNALHLALDQLLDNSIRYSIADLSIQIQIDHDDAFVNVLFIDNGLGIQDVENCIAVFESFRRLEEHRNAVSTEGSGLGLALVKSLIRGMGGTVECYSPMSDPHSDTRGLVVIFKLPHQNK